jgi:hypothetical protein
MYRGAGVTTLALHSCHDGAYWRGFGYSRVAELRERLNAVDDR